MSVNATIVNLAGGVHGYLQHDGSWWVNNAGIVSDKGNTLLFDTSATQLRTDALLDAVRQVATSPPQFLVLSHDHSDHSHGASRLPGATVIAHQAVRPVIERRGIVRNASGFTPFDVGDLDMRLPDITFNERITVYIGGIECWLIAAEEPAHSTGDVVCFVPSKGVLFAGDLVFNGVTPLLMSGSVSGTERVLAELLRPLKAKTVLPGHGGVTGGESIDVMTRYCELVRQIADDAMKRGRSPIDAAREADLGEFESWLDSERLVANLHRAIADREGVPPGGRLNFAKIMADMAELAGAPLLRTNA